MQIAGSTVLVSGATGGIGQAIAREFASAGAELVLTARDGSQLSALANTLGARAISADFRSAGDVDRLLAEAGPVDVLVANAAVAGAGRLSDVTVDELDEVLAVNLRAPMVLAHGVARGMRERGRGHVVFIGSAGSRVTSANSVTYNASKFGIRGFALALRQDLHESGVGVSIVEPVFVSDVGMFAESGVPLPKGMRTTSAEYVARAVTRAVRRNTAEVLAAPLDIRMGLAMGATFPEISARAGRLLGVHLQRPV